MKAVVTTPTGNVGSRVAQLLVQAGLRPTVLVRNAKKLDPGLVDSLDVVECDLMDGDAVVKGTAGADALYWVDPPNDTPDPIATYEAAGANAAAAIKKNGIPRVVFQSSVGAEKRHGAGEIDGMGRTEVQFDALDVSVTHLRCGYFYSNMFLSMPDLQNGVLRTTWPLDIKMPWVDPRDIGDVAAARILSSDWSGRNVQAVHGPRDMSFGEAAEIISETTGKAVRAERITDDELRTSLRSSGMGEGLVEAVVGMSSGLIDFEPENERTVMTTTPTTFEAWCYSVLRPAMLSAG